MLPDDVLLSIFGFCANEQGRRVERVWQTLVHVCRRWRSLVFGSPRGLDLQLICTPKTRARDMLDLWPPLPLVITSPWDNSEYYRIETTDADNIVAVLERRNRVCRIYISKTSNSHLEAMQESFPELTHLTLWSDRKPMAVLPDSFLGGSVPLLRTLWLDGIPFPGLPKLLLFSPHLTDLRLENIPHLGYIPPDAIATALSTLTSLGNLHLEFQSPLSFPDRASQRPPPPTSFVLPVLAYFWFKGVSEYLDDLVAHIDAPLLKELGITFFNQILFDTPQLVLFINRTSALRAPERARVIFIGSTRSMIKLSSRASVYGDLSVAILCEDTDWQVSALEQVCTCLPLLSTVEGLYIDAILLNWQDNIENALWLELLQPFTAVKNLYLSEKFAPHIMPSLQELVGERTTEVLPALQNIFLEGLETSGPVQESIQQFIAMRQASQPITVSGWG